MTTQTTPSRFKTAVGNHIKEFGLLDPLDSFNRSSRCTDRFIIEHNPNSSQMSYSSYAKDSDENKADYILTTSALQRSYNRFPTTSPFSRSASVISRGLTINRAYVPGPRFFDNVPGFTIKVPSTTWEH